MNVKDAVEKMEKRLEKAQETAEKYQKKGQEMEYLLVECEADKDSKKEKWRVISKRDRYYQKYAVAADYAEELEEVINVLKSKETEDKVVFVNEEKFENEYALYGESSEEWGNTIASMIRCDVGNGTSLLALCVKKLSD